MLSIFFLIYISGVFDAVAENNPTVTSLSFVEDLKSIVFGISVKNIFQTLDTIASIVLHWGNINTVTYDTSKIEVVLFSKSYCQQLNKQLCKANIKIGNKKIKFNKEVTKWLGIWLNNQ